MPVLRVRSTEHHEFLTDAQRRFVLEYCSVLEKSLLAGEVGEVVIDMDAVAEAAGKESQKPPFYYAEERQQNLFDCEACGESNDVLGTYAYCSACGTRNDLQEFENTIRGIRERINTGGPYEACVRDAVAAFDSLAGQFAKQLLLRVPLTRARKARLEKARFHNLGSVTDTFRSMFDIDVVEGLSGEDVAFAELTFHRRHVYEHKGGEADEKYIADSGDNVRVKQALRETRESAHRAANLVKKCAANLHDGFHNIFPPRAEPIALHAQLTRPRPRPAPS